MGLEVIIGGLVAAATTIGAYFGGKRTGRSGEVQIAADTVALLQASIAELERQSVELKAQTKAKDTVIIDLQARVEMLESLITQRAEVDELHKEVKVIHGKVDLLVGMIQS